MAQDSAHIDADIDTGLLDFVRETANTFVKWDLIRFFHDNPHTSNTAENIARFAGREARKVEIELTDLAAHSIINVTQAGDQRIYRFTRDPEIRETVQRFVQACDSRAFRIQAINQVIEGLQ